MGKLNGRLRIAVLERDGYRCVYCGAPAAESTLEVDHVLPRVHGGPDHPTNLVTACRNCNNGKRANRVALPAGFVPGDVDVSSVRRPRDSRSSGSAAPSWKLREVFDARFARYRNVKLRCATCGDPADSVHWLPYVLVRAGEEITVEAACPRHDPGGYWLWIVDLFRGPIDQRFNDPARRYTGLDHVSAKQGGVYSAYLAESLFDAHLEATR